MRVISVRSERLGYGHISLTPFHLVSTFFSWLWSDHFHLFHTFRKCIDSNPTHHRLDCKGLLIQNLIPPWHLTTTDSDEVEILGFYRFSGEGTVLIVPKALCFYTHWAIKMMQTDVYVSVDSSMDVVRSFFDDDVIGNGDGVFPGVCKLSSSCHFLPSKTK